jgi:hypothetical protein
MASLSAWIWLDYRFRGPRSRLAGDPNDRFASQAGPRRAIAKATGGSFRGGEAPVVRAAVVRRKLR